MLYEDNVIVRAVLICADVVRMVAKCLYTGRMKD